MYSSTPGFLVEICRLGNRMTGFVDSNTEVEKWEKSQKNGENSRKWEKFQKIGKNPRKMGKIPEKWEKFQKNGGKIPENSRKVRKNPRNSRKGTNIREKFLINGMRQKFQKKGANKGNKSA